MPIPLFFEVGAAVGAGEGKSAVALEGAEVDQGMLTEGTTFRRLRGECFCCCAGACCTVNGSPYSASRMSTRSAFS